MDRMADRCDQYCRLRGPLVLGGAPYPQQQKKHRGQRGSWASAEYRSRPTITVKPLNKKERDSIMDSKIIKQTAYELFGIGAGPEDAKSGKRAAQPA